MNIKKLLPLIAILSTFHVINNIDITNISILDYLVIISGTIVIGLYISRYIWRFLK